MRSAPLWKESPRYWVSDSVKVEGAASMVIERPSEQSLKFQPRFALSRNT